MGRPFSDKERSEFFRALHRQQGHPAPMQRFEFETTTELLDGLMHMAESCDAAAENHADSAHAARFWQTAAEALYEARRKIIETRTGVTGGLATQPEEPTMTHRIQVVQEILCDGSLVYDVHVGNLVLSAFDEDHANKLADKIAAAINEHTNHEAVGKYVW